MKNLKPAGNRVEQKLQQTLWEHKVSYMFRDCDSISIYEIETLL